LFQDRFIRKANKKARRVFLKKNLAGFKKKPRKGGSS
jgi:hypothetical protein